MGEITAALEKVWGRYEAGGEAGARAHAAPRMPVARLLPCCSAEGYRCAAGKQAVHACLLPRTVRRLVPACWAPTPRMSFSPH